MGEHASWATMNGNERIVDVEDARLALGALWTPGSSAVDTREGIRVGPGNPGRVTATSPTPDGKVHVAAFQGVLAASRGVGNYTTTLDADKEIDVLTANPADPSNGRNDLIVEVQSDTFYGDTATAYEVKLIVGDPAASPVDPITKIVSPDYRILARVRVDAGATSIDSGDIENFAAPWTVAAGGVLPIRNPAERDAITDPHDGQVIYRYDRDWIETWTGAAWRVQGVAVCTSTADRDNTITNPYSGQLVFVTSNATLYRYTGSAWSTMNPYVHAYQGGAVTIPNITATAIVMAQEVHDTLGWHSTVTNPSRVTPTLAGKYRCAGQIAMTGSVAGPFYGQFRKNGLEVPGGAYRTSHAVNQIFAANTAPAEATIDCNGSTDFIELFVHHAFGAAANTFSNASTNSWMRIEYLGP